MSDRARAICSMYAMEYSCIEIAKIYDMDKGEVAKIVNKYGKIRTKSESQQLRYRKAKTRSAR